MTTATIFAVFEDFNDQGETLPVEQVEVVPAPQVDIGELREEAWTDGYMTGRQEREAITPGSGTGSETADIAA